jgi:hypothetical protein
MKMLAVILLMGIAVAGVAAGDKDVQVKTDRFTGKTTITMRPIELKSPALGCFPCLDLMALAQDGQVSLVVISSNPEWLFLHGADVHVLADGKPIDLGHFEPADRRVNTFVMVTTTEYVMKTIDRAALDQMAAAGDLQIEVGSFQCKVKPKNAEHLKHFVEALPAK